MKNVIILEEVEKNYIKDKIEKIKTLTTINQNLSSTGTKLVKDLAQDIIDCLDGRGMNES